MLTGGSGNISYSWSDASTGAPIASPGLDPAEITNLSIGSYRLLGIDDNGCQFIDTFTLNLPLPVYPNVAITHPGCPGQNNAILTSTPSRWFWSISNLCLE